MMMSLLYRVHVVIYQPFSQNVNIDFCHGITITCVTSIRFKCQLRRRTIISTTSFSIHSRRCLLNCWCCNWIIYNTLFCFFWVNSFKLIWLLILQHLCSIWRNKFKLRKTSRSIHFACFIAMLQWCPTTWKTVCMYNLSNKNIFIRCLYLD